MTADPTCSDEMREMVEALLDIAKHWPLVPVNEATYNERRAALLSAIAEIQADRERLDWLGAQLNCIVTMRVAGGLGDRYLDISLLGSDTSLRESIDHYRSVEEPSNG